MKLSVVHFTYINPNTYLGGLSKYLNDVIECQLNKREIVDAVHVFYPGHNELLSEKPRLKRTKYGRLDYIELINTNYASLSGGTLYPQRDTSNIALEDLIIQYLITEKINIVHFHAFLGLSSDLLNKISQLGISLFCTTHDFHAICPIVNLLNTKGARCYDIGDGEECCRCNAGALNKQKLKFMHSRIGKKIQKNQKIKNYVKNRLLKNRSIRTLSGTNVNYELKSAYKHRYDSFLSAMNDVIDMTFFNSSLTKQTYEAHGFTGEGMVFPLTHSGLNQIIENYRIQISCDEKIRFGFLGGGRIEKGGNALLKVFSKLKSEHYSNWSLKLYGADITSLDIPCEVDKHVAVKGYDKGNIFDSFDVLIVPSIWIETFGFVVPEALLKKKLVITSATVGASQELEGCRGIVIYKDNEALLSILKGLLNQGYTDEVTFTQDQRNMFLLSNHTEKLMSVYRSIMEKKQTSSPVVDA